MTVAINDLYCVVYFNHLKNEVQAYSKLFDNLEQAQAMAEEVNGNVQRVFYSNK
jgi:hypothetical protein